MKGAEYRIMSTKVLAMYLRELRQSYDYSQEFVASHLDIIRQTYSHYETGRIIPPIDILYKLSQLYQIPIIKFIELSITDNVHMDYQMETSSLPDNHLSLFLEYVNRPDKKTAFKGLTRTEKELLFYFQHLTKENQDDILDFLKIKYNKLSK